MKSLETLAAQPSGAGPAAAGGQETSRSRKLRSVLILTGSYTLAEALGGWWTNSLALLADAGHMLTDDLALALALFAAHIARRPPDPSRTYGYARAEILAALANGVFLVLLCLFLFWEAWERLLNPPAVRAAPMAAVAAGGLLVNLLAARVLAGHGQGLNVRAAYLHVLGDLLGSIGVLAAAALIGWRGWVWADPVASIAIGLIIVVASVRLVLESVHVLMEGVPSHLDAEEIRRCLLETPGVEDIHDLHVWSLGGGVPLLTAHLVVDHGVVQAEVLREASRRLRGRFGIAHATLQVEPPDFNIVDGLTSP